LIGEVKQSIQGVVDQNQHRIDVKKVFEDVIKVRQMVNGF
jgi:hypothetical protein